MSRAKTLSAVLALYVGDEAIKKYMMHHLKDGEEKPVLGGKLRLHRLENPGAAMGLGKEHQKLLNAFAAAMLAILGVRLFQLDKTSGKNREKAALILLLAGGLGNLTDRICQGHVDDYLRIPCRSEKLSRVVFNLADVFVAAGTGWSVLAALGNETDHE